MRKEGLYAVSQVLSGRAPRERHSDREPAKAHKNDFCSVNDMNVLLYNRFCVSRGAAFPHSEYHANADVVLVGECNTASAK